MISAKSFWLLAYPLVLAGFSTPLLGVVDTIFIANTGQLTAIGAVAVGAVVFNTMYWLFGFLKISTSGFTAQSIGQNDLTAVQMNLYRPLIIAVSIGLLFIVCLVPIRELAVHVFVRDATLIEPVKTYISARMFAAPFALGTYVILGWLIGHGKVRSSLLVQVSGNVLNILLDVWFINSFNDPVFGIATATCIAEILTFSFGLYVIKQHVTLQKSFLVNLLSWQPYKTYFTVNRDLFIRTIFLLVMTGWFTSLGARQGVDVLSANSILFQLQYLIAYWFGGIGHASTIFIGGAIGRNSKVEYMRTIKVSFYFLLWSTIGITLLLVLAQHQILRLFTEDLTLLSTIETYYVWLLLYPIAASTAMWLEGVYAGIGNARPVRNSLIYAFIIFAVTVLLFVPMIGNHGIWIAFISFSATRSFSLFISEKRKRHSLFSSASL